MNNRRPESRTIPGLVREQATVHGDRMAVIGTGMRLSYRQLHGEVLAVARRLHRLGVQPGDHVAVLMGNRPEWITSALAIASLGCVAVAVNTWATPSELEYILTHSDARLLIACRRFLKTDYAKSLNELQPHAERLPLLRGIIGVGEELPADWLPLAQPAAAPDAEEDRAIARRFDAVRPQDIAFLLYTSGSTAAPKGVQLQHFALIENTWDIGERLHVTAADKLWLAVSLFWGYGCSNALTNMLTHGATIVLQEWFDAAQALAQIEQERCTLLYSTPNMIEALCDHPDRARRDLSCLRGGAAGGSRKDLQRAMSLAPDACQIFGMTECYGNTHVVAVDDPMELRLTSCGRPLPGFRQKVVAPDGKVLPPGQVGELLVKGYVTPGYYKDPALSAQALDAEGYFKTGDLVQLDEQGYMYFRGRLKEMVKTGGINVSPAEVEAVLMTHPSIKMVQVVGVPDAVKDEVLGAVIIRKPDAELSTDEVLAFCKERMAAYKVPRFVHFAQLADLPLTSTGKVQKNLIAKTFFRQAS